MADDLMRDFEKLGAFYLGRTLAEPGGDLTETPLMYDAKDLTTHAVCVGMTGSGKTGLCTCLLEEAAIDGIPALILDVKGDLTNLLLTFPDLLPSDFEPWVDPGTAARKGLSVSELAAKTSELWRNGLADWGQDGARIQRLKDAVEMQLFTPGSTAATPRSILKSFQAPPQEVLSDSDLLGERIEGSVSGLLTLLGVDADPLRSREHILLANILNHAWRKGEDVELAQLIRLVQKPPLIQVGVLDLETFYPAKERMELAMLLNNLLAAPDFATWLAGEPLDIGNLLWNEDGKPRLSIIYIAHLSEAERMFFVTLLLNEVLSWVRAQSGTSSLRALLYMDEVFGYLPPVANPPSKKPIMTMLKQARAFGLGLVLATQNPADLDYKALSNAGTWFLGRLQTERDKQRVLEGLEGASAAGGARFDRAQMEATLAGLSSRVFLLNNVHEDEPVLFHTRWAMSYLRGPLTRAQLGGLVKPQVERQPSSAEPATPVPASRVTHVERPLLPREANEQFAALPAAAAAASEISYRPALVGQAKLHFVRASVDIDYWKPVTLLSYLTEDQQVSWESSRSISPGSLMLTAKPAVGASFSGVPPAACQAKSYAAWAKDLKEHLYQTRSTAYWRYPAGKLVSRASETKREFAARAGLLVREERDEELGKLRKKYQQRRESLERKLNQAEARLAREKAEYSHKKLDSAINIGSTILEALFSRKKLSRSNAGRAGSAARGAGRAASQKREVKEAQRKIAQLTQDQFELERELRAKLAEIRQKHDPAAGVVLEERRLAPRKSDIDIEQVSLVWVPEVKNP